MSRECWLRTNIRATSLGFLVPALLALLGLVLMLALPGQSGFSLWQWLGAALLALAVVMAAAVAYLMRLPRLGYEGGRLLVYLKGMTPFRVPVDIVEVFFLGQTESMVPGRGGTSAKTTAVVVRLAEKAKEWHQRDVSPALGKWRDGYITIRGTWCEPISPEVLERLNHRLVAAHRRQRDSGEAVAS